MSYPISIDFAVPPSQATSLFSGGFTATKVGSEAGSAGGAFTNLGGGLIQWVGTRSSTFLGSIVFKDSTTYVWAAEAVSPPPLSQGSGDILVTDSVGHDQGTDGLQFQDDGIGLDGVTVRAYIQSEYQAGNYEVRGESHTGSDGRWIEPMYLNANTYTFVGSRPGYQAVVVPDVLVE